MTDPNPSPTTRMPLPNEPAPTESDAQPDDPSPVPPAPPVPPVPPMPERRRREERDAGRTASVLFGLVILGLGLWFFAEVTLGYELPRISWSQIWPVSLIVVGLWVVLGSMRRGSR